MRILILGINYPPEQVGIAVYTGGLARALAEAGHEVEVVAGRPYYPHWKVPAGYRGGGWRRTVEARVRVTRCPLYVPANPSGARRILHHLSFAATALVPMLGAALRRRPDVVLTVAPSLIAAPVARLAAALARAPSWLHIQDFEVEAAFATGLMNSGGKLAGAALAFQKQVLKAFDVVSTISPQMCAKLESLGVEKTRIVELRNWSALDQVRVLDTDSPFRAKWGIGQAKVALYSGNIANKQGIEIIVDAARKLAHRRDILFVVCGDGPNKDALVRRTEGLANIRFEPLQPFEALGDLLGLASVHLLPQLADAADLVLPSKLTNMLASGRPIVATVAQGTGLASEVEGCGLVVPPGDVDAFAAAIIALADDPQRAASLSRAGRRRAEERWSQSAILSRFEARLASLAARRGSIIGAEGQRPLPKP